MRKHKSYVRLMTLVSVALSAAVLTGCDAITEGEVTSTRCWTVTEIRDWEGEVMTSDKTYNCVTETH